MEFSSSQATVVRGSSPKLNSHQTTYYERALSPLTPEEPVGKIFSLSLWTLSPEIIA